MNKKLLSAFALAISMTFSFSASIEGTWKTIDDITHQPKALVKIQRTGNTYFGTVTYLFPGAMKICTMCSGQNKNRPILNLVILKGLKDVGNNVYENGRLFDPESGRTYSGSAQLLNRDQLKLHGYIGIKLLGRSQIWQRVR